MKTSTNNTTYNTSYHSDDGIFSSMSRQAVQAYEERGEKPEDMNHATKVFWQISGHFRVKGYC